MKLQTLLTLSVAAYASSLVASDTVAACLILEAGGEGRVGMQAVANVIANRSAKSGKSLEREALKKWQFSCFNGISKEAAVAKARKHSAWPVAAELAKEAESGALPDITHGATHYYAPKVCGTPAWAWKLPYCGTIGNHKFHREENYK